MLQVHRLPGRARCAALRFAAIAIATAGCAGLPPEADAPPLCDSGGSGRSYTSLDAAAVGALAHASGAAGARRQLWAGTIRHTEAGYAWCRPLRSARSIGSRDRPALALGLRARDAAVYVIRPVERSRRCASEQPSEADWRLVRAPRARPRLLYLLTPAGRVLRLAPSGELRVVAQLEEGGGDGVPPSDAEVASLPRTGPPDSGCESPG